MATPSWRSILLEASFVVLGVVLALAANEWRQHAAQQQAARTARASIHDELLANRERVRSAVLYHAMLNDTLHTLVARSAPQPPAGLFARGFVHPAPTYATAWETAQATGIVAHLPYRDVLELASIYEQQRTYVRQAEQVGDLIYTRLFTSGYDGVLANYRHFTSILSTFIYRECGLLAAYERLLPEAPDDVPPVCAYFADER